MMVPVLDIHDGAWRTIHQPSEVFLRPAFFLSFAFDFPARDVEVKLFVVLVHSHLTIYYSIFRVRL